MKLAPHWGFEGGAEVPGEVGGVGGFHEVRVAGGLGQTWFAAAAVGSDLDFAAFAEAGEFEPLDLVVAFVAGDNHGRAGYAGTGAVADSAGEARHVGVAEFAGEFDDYADRGADREVGAALGFEGGLRPSPKTAS